MPVAVIVEIVAVMLVVVVAFALVNWRQGISARHQHERLNVYRQRDDAIADIQAMRREAERRMRRIVRDDPSVIEGSVVEDE